MKYFSFQAILGVIVVLFWPHPVLAQTPTPEPNAWPMAGANPQRTSWTPEEVRGQLQPLWYRHFEPFINQKFQVMAQNGLLYITTAKGIYALNADTGTTVWVFPTDMPLGNSPTISGNTLYVGSYDHHLYALPAHPDPNTLPTQTLSDGTTVKINNQPLFTFTADQGFETNPLVVNNTVYLGNRDGYFYALDAATGALKWKYQTDGPILFSAAFKNNLVYFASNDSYAYALNAGSGTLAWKSGKLPGAGFHSWWPVVYTDPLTQKDWVIFAGSENYRTNVPPGPNSQFHPIENKDVNPQSGLDPTGTLLGPLGTVPGLWVSGTPTVDFSQPTVTANGSTTPITKYLEQKPWRRTYFVLDALTGQEYTTDFDHNGQPEYAAILWQGTHSGNRYPPVIGQDHVIYQANDYYSDQYINGGNISGWQLGTPYISLVTGSWLAVDEPYAYTAGGNLLYWNHTCLRTAGSIDTAQPDTQLITSYQAGTRPPNDNQQSGLRQWTYWIYFLENKIPDIFSQVSSNGSTTNYGIFGSNNGIYSCHGNQTAPLPYRGKVYLMGTNALMAWAPQAAQNTHVPLAQTVPVTPTPGPNLTIDTLKSKLAVEVQKMITAGHLRPGYDHTGILDFSMSRWCGTEKQTDYFHYPSETLFYLIRALPYLSPTLQTQTKTYLQAEFNLINPWQYNSIGWKDGAKRETYDTPPEVQTDTQYYGPEPGYYDNWSYFPVQFYYLWQYTKVFGGAQTIFNAAKSRLENPLTDAQFATMPNALNGYIAGYLGYLQLQQLAGYPQDPAKQTTLTHLINLRLTTFSPDAPPAIVNSTDFLTHTCLGVNLSRNYMFMVPELADYFRDPQNQVIGKINTQLAEIDRIAPYWFVSKFDVGFGETVLDHLYDYHTIFQVKALVLKQSREELTKYLDVPAFQVGDLFYIDNLVSAIEAQPSGTAPLPGDYNSDGVVDYRDWFTFIPNFGSGDSSFKLVPGSLVNIFDLNKLIGLIFK